MRFTCLLWPTFVVVKTLLGGLTNSVVALTLDMGHWLMPFLCSRGGYARVEEEALSVRSFGVRCTKKEEIGLLPNQRYPGEVVSEDEKIKASEMLVAPRISECFGLL